MKSKRTVILLLFVLIVLGVCLNVSVPNVYAVSSNNVSEQVLYKAYTIKSVIVREKAKDSSKKIETLDFCEKVTVIEKKNEKWVKIRASSGKIGYVAEEKLSKQKPYKAYTIKSVIVREKAKDSSKKIETLDFCKKLTVIEKKNEKWVKIRTSSGKIGYVAEEKLSKQKPYKAYTIKSVIVRQKAKNSSKKIETLDFCEKVTVIEKTNEKWVKIRTSSGKIGYVAEEKLSKQKPYKAYTIKSVIVRQKAKNSSKKIETLDFCEKITVIEKKNEKWVKIRTSSGKIGYVAEEKLSKQKPYKAYTIKSVIVRQKAKNSSKKIETLDFCEKVTVIEKKNEKWVKIRTSSGKIGYVAEEKLSRKKPYINKKGYVKVVSSLYLRKTPSQSAGVVTTLKPAEIVTIVTKKDGWYKVTTSSGKMGYVKTKYISTSDPKKLELLVTYTTYSKGSSANRNFNIARACSKINGKILKPGQTFNWFNVVGSCGGQNGYKKATVIVNGKYIQDYGGGVCQVATTLCGAAKNLKIKNIYCRPHTGHVSYLNGDGVEAAVSYGSKNFKFTNTTGSTIKLEMYSSGGRVIAAVYKVR